MKRNRHSGSQQPAIDTAYIDFLLSGEKPKRTRKPIPTKLWFFLGGAVLAVLLCLFLPNFLANLQVEMWQARCGEAYAQMRAGLVGHYTVQTTRQKAGQEPEVWELTEVWSDGENRLTDRLKKVSIDPNVPHVGVTPDDQSLVLDGQIYSRNITPQDPEPLWEWVRRASEPSAENSRTWLDMGYVFSSIRADLSGVEVTWETELSLDLVRTVYCFDLFGNFTGLTQSLEKPKTQVTEMTYTTLCPTSQKEIAAIFEKCRQEVEKIEIWMDE